MNLQTKLVAISAHPDDAELCAGGTMATYSSKGADVTTVNMTKSRKSLPLVPEDFVGDIRVKESKRATEILGVKSVFLNLRDTGVIASPSVIDVLVAKIRALTPTIILTHSPNDHHPDHRNTSLATQTACYWAKISGVRGNDPPHAVSSIYFWEGYSTRMFSPDVYIDISRTYDLKKKALKAYKTQCKFLKDEFTYSLLNCRLRGIQAGVKYAEAFQSYLRNVFSFFPLSRQ